MDRVRRDTEKELSLQERHVGYLSPIYALKLTSSPWAGDNVGGVERGELVCEG